VPSPTTVGWMTTLRIDFSASLAMVFGVFSLVLKGSINVLIQLVVV
jgi:hypothetical protein